MFFEKQKEIEKLRRRIVELEERLCPYETHEWIIVDENISTDFSGGIIETFTVRELHCSVCGKWASDDNRVFGFKYNKAIKPERVNF